MLVLAVVAFVQEARTAWEQGKTNLAVGSAVAGVLVAVVAVLMVRLMMRRD